MIKKTISIVLILLFIMIPAAVSAEDIDMDRACTLKIVAGDDTSVAEKMEFNLYQIATLDTGTVYCMNDAYEELDIKFTTENADRWEEYTQTLAKYVVDNDIEPSDYSSVDKSGAAKFPYILDVLTPGIYLVTSEKMENDENGFDVEPFLVSLPVYDDEEYIYDVVSSPKVDGIYEIEKDEVLPQTGALWWPCPILFVSGLMLMILGFRIRRREKYER